MNKLKPSFYWGLLRAFLAVSLWSVSAVTWSADQAAVDPQEETAEYAAPRWALEFKGGKYKPDLERYKEFYGSDTNTFLAIGGAWRVNNWFELGGELGYSKDRGVGLLQNSGETGGSVKYTLMPLQLFANFRYDRSLNQLFVPYAGIGVVTAWYRQEIDQQPDRKGRTDVGGSARVGLQLLLNRLDKGSAQYLRGDRRLRSYLFLEGQYFSTKVDGIDLGGEIFLLGLRMEFD
jgi:opacity protein-like surface antigen